MLVSEPLNKSLAVMTMQKSLIYLARPGGCDLETPSADLALGWREVFKKLLFTSTVFISDSLLALAGGR